MAAVKVVKLKILKIVKLLIITEGDFVLIYYDFTVVESKPVKNVPRFPETRLVTISVVIMAF